MDQGSDGPSTVERGRRRRPVNSAPPIWFGIPFLAMGLLTLVLGVAAATGNTPPGTTVSGSPLVIAGFGAFFALIGAGLLWTSIRGRRLERRVSTDPSGSAPAAPRPDALETIRFTRSPLRVLMDLVLAPIGGIAFLGFAVFLLGTGGMGILLALVPAFFGVLLLAGAGITMRRGIRMQIAVVGPAGIWTPEMGRLAWSQIGELRVEDMRGVGGANNTGTAIYRRLGVVPRDPALAARAPGRMAIGMVRGFTGLANSLRPGVGLSDPSALAPYGINASEIEQPFEQVVAAVERYMPVTVAGVVPSTPPVLPGLGVSVLGGLPGVIGEMPTGPAGGPGSAPVDFAPAAGGAGTSPADHPAPRTFHRRSSIIPIGGLGTLGDIGIAVFWIAFPAFFLVASPLIFFGGGGSLGPEAILFLAFLLIPLSFALYGVGQVLQVPGRQRIRTGRTDLLTVDADGVDMRGMGRLRWSEIREVRAVDSGRPTGEGSPSIPRLEILPRDPRRFGEQPRADRWYDAYRSFLRRLKPFGDRSPVEPAFRLDFDLLDASPDEVLDLIARYRVVDDRT